MRVLLLTISGVFFVLSLNLKAFELVGAGELPPIVLSETPEQSTELAAKELADYVQKISGRRMQIVKGNTSAEKQIIIGTLDDLRNIPEHIAEKLRNSEKADSFYIGVQGNRLYIVGKKKVGEIYGVYHFIESKLGVRWLKPADKFDSGEYVPKKSRISFDDFELLSEPFFDYRVLDQSGSVWNVIPRNGFIWALRNGFQIRPPYGMRPDKTCEFEEFFVPRVVDHILGEGAHTTFSNAIPADKYFSTNPEYFTMLDNKRTLFDGGHKCYQYCISNPGVQDLVASYVLDRIRKYGNDRYSFLFGMTDTSVGWCECPECRRLDDSARYNYLNISTRFHKVVKKISDKIYSEQPDARLRVWAYHTYRNLPKQVKYDPRMLIQFCIHGRCYGHALDDPNCMRNTKLLALLKEWMKLSGNIFTYEYFTSTPPLYVPHERGQARDLKLYKKLGIKGWKEEAPFEDSRFAGLRKDDPRPDVFPSMWQWLYVTGKLLWNPDLDVNELIADAEGKYYGAAYPAMKKYHDLRRKLWENNTNCMGYPTGDQRRPTLLNMPGAKTALLECLDEAEKLAGNDKILLYRIGLDRKFLDKYWIRPNEEIKTMLGKAFRAPQVKGKITIDGDGKDPAWAGAYYTDDFKETFTDEHAPVPERLKTTVGILSDEQNLYFLIKAREPRVAAITAEADKDGPVWKDDSIELFIYPPTAANVYYQIVVNPKGTVFDAICPGNNVKYDLGVEAKGKILADGYVVELKVPADKIADFQRGAVWRVHFARNRRIKEDGVARNFSIDGTGYHDNCAYRALEIGEPYLKNGSFDDVKNGKPTHWSLSPNAKAVERGNGHALAITSSGRCYQNLIDPELRQSSEPRKISIVFKASGNKNLNLFFYRYSDIPDSTQKHGYKRTFLPTAAAGTFQLEETPQVFRAEYTIAPDEWVALAFQTYFDAIIDDVSVELIK